MKYRLTTVGLGACHKVEAHHAAHRIPNALVFPVFFRTRKGYSHLQ